MTLKVVVICLAIGAFINISRTFVLNGLSALAKWIMKGCGKKSLLSRYDRS